MSESNARPARVRQRLRSVLAWMFATFVAAVLLGCVAAEIVVARYLATPLPVGYIRASDVSRPFLDATVAMEDGHFYQHRGFDWEAIRRALAVDLKSGRIRQGGSTITQQLAKNVFLDGNKTPWRKCCEAFLTVELERRLTKEQILERYVNVVDYGMGQRGIGSAAEWYFGKSPCSLTLGESAMLVGTVPRPFVGSISLSRLEGVRETALGRIGYFFPQAYSDQQISEAEMLQPSRVLSPKPFGQRATLEILLMPSPKGSKTS